MHLFGLAFAIIATYFENKSQMALEMESNSTYIFHLTTWNKPGSTGSLVLLAKVANLTLEMLWLEK